MLTLRSEAYCNHTSPSTDAKEEQQYSTDGYHLRKTARNRARGRALKNDENKFIIPFPGKQKQS